MTYVIICLWYNKLLEHIVYIWQVWLYIYPTSSKHKRKKYISIRKNICREWTRAGGEGIEGQRDNNIYILTYPLGKNNSKQP